MAIGGIIGATLIKFLVGSFWDKASGWADGYMEKRKTIDTAKAEMELTKAKIEAAVYEKRVTAEIEWETRALETQERSWKDEYILILWSIPLMGIFIPGLQGYVQEGFRNLDNVPSWYFQGWGVIVASVYGAKRFVDMVDKYTTSRHEQKMASIDARSPAPTEAPPAPPVAKPKATKKLLPHQLQEGGQA